VQEGGLAPLIALLKSPVVNILQHSAACLRNVSVREGNDVKIALEGGLGPLIALLSHPSAEVQLHACGAVRNLSVNDENKVKIARDVGLRPLIELLSSSVVEIQEQAVIALRNLCANRCAVCCAWTLLCGSMLVALAECEDRAATAPCNPCSVHASRVIVSRIYARVFPAHALSKP
jgi:hypothetical protein